MEQKQKIRLDVITLMRTILALLIVFMHSFTIYQGGWTKPSGYIDIPIYKWIARTSFAFTLEAFVFISGYLYAFQRITLNRDGGVIDLIINKLKRLLLPSVVFSILYFPLFCEYKGLADFAYSILNGCGHMWFLPMLFWCFIGGWILDQIRIGDGWKMTILAVLNIFTFISLPMQLSKATSYLFYFYGGIVVYKQSNSLKSIINGKCILVGWVLFVAVFALLRPLKSSLTIGSTDCFVNSLLTISGRHACQLIYASGGTIAFYLSALYYTNKHRLRLFTNKLASCCFGIYLFQQFILKGLFYKTVFAAIVGPYWLPWLGFIIALPLSYLLTIFLLKTKVGRYLIG